MPVSPLYSIHMPEVKKPVHAGFIYQSLDLPFPKYPKDIFNASQTVADVEENFTRRVPDDCIEI